VIGCDGVGDVVNVVILCNILLERWTDEGLSLIIIYLLHRARGL